MKPLQSSRIMNTDGIRQIRPLYRHGQFHTLALGTQNLQYTIFEFQITFRIIASKTQLLLLLIGQATGIDAQLCIQTGGNPIIVCKIILAIHEFHKTQSMFRYFRKGFHFRKASQFTFRLSQSHCKVSDICPIHRNRHSRAMDIQRTKTDLASIGKQYLARQNIVNRRRIIIDTYLRQFLRCLESNRYGFLFV